MTHLADAPPRRVPPCAAAACALLLGAASMAPAPPVRADYAAAQAALERGEYATALREHREAAAADDPRSQAALARMYLQGQGVRTDVHRAMGWLCLLVHHPEGGPAVSQGLWYLATYFHSGGGLPEGRRRGHPERADPVRAYFWFGVQARQSELFTAGDPAGELLGRIGLGEAGGVFYPEEREALNEAIRRWRPGRPVHSREACLALPEGLVAADRLPTP